MLDGLLGRSGFYSKSKSLIKLTRKRIDVVRRKRNATQKFLRKDIADLLANGLDSNAFGRAEGLIAELIQSSCYDFIDHVCEIILKHLPVLEKIRDCPEDCREAVASLMFAAARFSDLPELRELRDLFQERYGSSVECYVNQKLVENITPKPPSMEKKIQLMQEIAAEFSIRWDSRGFEARMSSFAATEKNHQQSPGTIHAAAYKVATPFAEETGRKTLKVELVAKNTREATYRNKEREVERHQKEVAREGTLERRDDLKHYVSRGPEVIADKYKPPSYREETTRNREDHHISHSKKNDAQEAVQFGTPRGKRLECVGSQDKRDRHREDRLMERNSSNTLSQQKPSQLPGNNGIKSPSAVDNEFAEDIRATSMRKREDIPDGVKSNFRSAIPPPYVKPRKSKHKIDADQNDTLTFNPGSNGNGSEKVETEADLPDHQEGGPGPGKEDGPPRFTEIYYQDGFTPRRRSHSHRRKHTRTSSNQDDKLNGETGPQEERVIRRVSTSRRKHESRKGLQILFDDDHYHKKDEEERMIDKLLLHYSKKPPSGEPEKPRRKTNGETYDKRGKSPNVDEDVSTPTTSRSMSLPSQHVTEPEPQKKVFARASSFQQDAPAKHVHPKLPDYDDLAARFAALRASRD